MQFYYWLVSYYIYTCINVTCAGTRLHRYTSDFWRGLIQLSFIPVCSPFTQIVPRVCTLVLFIEHSHSSWDCLSVSGPSDSGSRATSGGTREAELRTTSIEVRNHNEGHTTRYGEITYMAETDTANCTHTYQMIWCLLILSYCWNIWMSELLYTVLFMITDI